APQPGQAEERRAALERSDVGNQVGAQGGAVGLRELQPGTVGAKGAEVKHVPRKGGFVREAGPREGAGLELRRPGGGAVARPDLCSVVEDDFTVDGVQDAGAVVGNGPDGVAVPSLMALTHSPT